MARPLRLEFAGALYHITSRGDRREAIYEGNMDREAFLSILDKVCETYNWACHAYCLMDNHYHLLIETPDANLARGMRQLNGVYTQTFNRANGRVGHVFQGRYKAILAEKESYLLELSRYIVLNPVRAGMVRSAREWPWSSYRAMVGQSKVRRCLTTEWLLSVFGKKKGLAIERYKKFVLEGKGQPAPWENLSNQVFLGSEQYIDKMLALIDGEKELSEIPMSQKRAAPKALADYASLNKDRNTAIHQAYSSGGYTLKEIGDYFGLHYSTVSGILKNHKSKT
jgi:REP element-mobilizing transposase RayT